MPELLFHTVLQMPGRLYKSEYWGDLKKKLHSERSELNEKIGQFERRNSVVRKNHTPEIGSSKGK